MGVALYFFQNDCKSRPSLHIMKLALLSVVWGHHQLNGESKDIQLSVNDSYHQGGHLTEVTSFSYFSTPTKLEKH